MSTVNYYQASQTAQFSQPAEQPLEIGLEFQPVMKGARLSYGAAVLVIAGLFLSGWLILAAAVTQCCGLFLLRKVPAASRAVTLLTAAFALFTAATLSILLSMVMVQYQELVIAEYLSMARMLLWGIASVLLLLGIRRIGLYVNQPGAVKHAKSALIMLAITLVGIASMYLVWLNPSLLVEMQLVTNLDSVSRVVDALSILSWVPAVIGLVFYSQAVSPISRLAELQLAERATKTNFAELGAVNVPVRGQEMDFLQL